MSGAFYMPENMAGGGALIDFDGDGDLDLYLVQGHTLGPGSDARSTDRLLRNDLPEAFRFTDVTGAAGVEPSAAYRMGAAAGDVDGDGRTDLYVTAFGADRLLRNLGGGRFEDVTAQAGLGETRWSVPAVFFDVEGDGDLDLFVGNYLDFTWESHRPCVTRAGAPDYCDPDVFAAVPDRLFLNRGNESGIPRFEDVTAAAGLAAAFGKALGAVAADFDGDGDLDLYVANDRTENQLWMNRGDGTFSEEALLAGCALNGDGEAEASMGVAAEDVDQDGDFDLVMTHFSGETHTLFRNDGSGFFEDVTLAAGLAAPTLAATGFGVGLVDLDGDTVLDLVAVNGAVRAIEELARAGEAYPFQQPNQLFRGLAEGRFEELSTALAPTFLQPSEVSRGALFGDLDNDGDRDVVVLNNNGPARLYLGTRQARGGSWLGLRLVTGDPPRDALGARVEVLRAAHRPLLRRVGTDGSYASSGDPRLTVFLGDGTPSGLRVTWPDGTVQTVAAADLAAGRYVTLRREG